MVVYVNDLIIIGSSIDLIQEEKYILWNTFEMTNLGLLHFCLDIEVCQQPNTIFMSEEKHAQSCYKSLEWNNIIPTKHQ
jgi:hypothetical protein